MTVTNAAGLSIVFYLSSQKIMIFLLFFFLEKRIGKLG